MNISLFIFDRRILNYFVIVVLTIITFLWTFWIFHETFLALVVIVVIFIRILASSLFFKDYSLSWSKARPKSFLIKSVVYMAAFVVYMPFFYGKVRIALMLSELAFFLFAINFLMYAYAYVINRKHREKKTKSVVIYGAGKAGLKLEEEFQNSPYKVRFFVDDDPLLQTRSIDGIPILSVNKLKHILNEKKENLLVIAIPSARQKRVQEIYDDLKDFFDEILILPPLDNILRDTPFSKQLKEITVEDLLARHPKDLDKKTIRKFIENRIVLITGAGGSIGSELARQCVKYGAQKLVLLDHSEYNLYKIEQELAESSVPFVCVMQSVVDKERLEKTFKTHRPQIVLHAAAYKHVPLCEENVEEAILNNIIGTKNCIDLAVEYGVQKFVLISTDKAVRPTNVMGATKRVCELYAQNKPSGKTEIVAVRFGNVLGSSGSVIPKFKEQIERGGPVTVTHPEVTRYFMLIPEACELVLQAGAIGKGGEIFILDMGEPVKIVDLAKKMIELSGQNNIEIKFTGLRPGEKLYEELLIDKTHAKTLYESITIAPKTPYN
ncbi:MAG: polysaccharide biosynthesis protein, partial [Epsilonproteobacteria bacterium]|nr:polysaccharide biosynthesis protein [Campylobacterota bacterium]